MDPNKALRAARAAADRVLADDPAAAYELVQYFTALDKRLTSGGFPPADWQSTSPAGVVWEAPHLDGEPLMPKRNTWCSAIQRYLHEVVVLSFGSNSSRINRCCCQHEDSRAIRDEEMT
jgi:hypothetical protein